MKKLTASNNGDGKRIIIDDALTKLDKSYKFLGEIIGDKNQAKKFYELFYHRKLTDVEVIKF